jgi:single stranded DNA-binding protein
LEGRHGEWQTKVHWHEIVVHRDSTIRWIKGVLKRGNLVHVEGRLTYHHWEDRHNQNRRKAQIIVSEHYGKVERPTDQKQNSKPLSALIEPIPEFDEASEASDDNHHQHPLEEMPFLLPQSDHRQGRAPQQPIGENS